MYKKRASNALAEIFSDEEMSMVYTKQDKEARKPLIDDLISIGIDGWIGPVETSFINWEVCIFRPLTVLSSLIEKEKSLNQFTLDCKIDVSLGTEREGLHVLKKAIEECKDDQWFTWTPLDRFLQETS